MVIDGYSSGFADSALIDTRTGRTFVEEVNERVTLLQQLPAKELDERIVEMITRDLIPSWKDGLREITTELNESLPGDVEKHEELRPRLEELFTLTDRQVIAAELAMDRGDAQLEAIIYDVIVAISRTTLSRFLDSDTSTIGRVAGLARVPPVTPETLEVVTGHDVPHVKATPLHVESQCDRVYQNPNGYRSYAHPFGVYGRFLDEHSGDGFKRAIAAEKTGLIPLVAAYYVSALALALAGWPLYWIGHDILMAAMASDLPDDLNAEDVKWPRDAMTFMLPVGTLREGDGHVEFITIARHTDALESADASLAERDDVAPFAESYRGFMMIDTYHSKETVGQSTYTLRGPLSRILNRTSSAAVDQDRHAWGLMGIDLSEVKASTNDIVKTAINLLLIMQARRELLTGGEAIKRVKSKVRGKIGRETLWSPLWIGKDYHIQREASGPGGSHNSPRMHWRRGHWRNLVFGPRLTADKQPIPAAARHHEPHWFEPTLVNAKPVIKGE